MAIRIKSNWSKTVKREKTSEDIASALSYIGWKLSLDKARNLHGEDFDYSSDHQRVAVIVEYMSFQVHLADRLLFLDKKSSATYFVAFLLKFSDIASILFTNPPFYSKITRKGDSFPKFCENRTDSNLIYFCDGIRN